MTLVINTNVASINAQRYLSTNTMQLNKSMERLASGYRINKGADDSAGLQISETLRAQIRGSQKALDNVQDGTNVLNIMDGAMAQITENIQRMRELAVQAANDTLASTQRTAIKNEIDELSKDITRISDATEYNGVKLLNGTQSNFFVQVGANANNTVDRIDMASSGNVFADIDATALSVNNLTVSDNTNAQTSISTLDSALTTVNNRRATIGALTNRLQSAANNLSVNIENLSSAESRIRNVDVAKESAQLTRNQILQQASSTILGQANQSPQLALSLLRG
jgi:flagellin